MASVRDRLRGMTYLILRKAHVFERINFAAYTSHSIAAFRSGSKVMAITLMHTVICMWLGMAAAMLTVLQVSYSRSKHARTNKERAARAASHPHGDAR
jgi:hypothetical protein